MAFSGIIVSLIHNPVLFSCTVVSLVYIFALFAEIPVLKFYKFVPLSENLGVFLLWCK